MNDSTPSRVHTYAMKLSQRVTRHPWSAYLCLAIGLCFLISGLDVEGQVMGVIHGSVFDLTLGWLALLGVAGCLVMLLLKASLADPNPPVSTTYRRVVLRVAGFLVLLGCVQHMASLIYPAVRQAQRHAASEKIQQEQTWGSRIIGDAPFQLQVPEHWVNVAGSAEVDTPHLLLGDRETNLYVNADATAKQSVEFSRLEDLAAASSESITKAPDTTMTGFEYASLNSFRIGTARSRNLYDGVEYQHLVRIVDGDSHWIELSVWSTPGNMELYAETFQRILGSIEAVQTDTN